MESVFLRFVNIGISSTGIIIVMILLRIMIRNNSKSLQSNLWKIIWIRMCIPCSINEMLEMIVRIVNNYYTNIAEGEQNLVTSISQENTVYLSNGITNTIVYSTRKQVNASLYLPKRLVFVLSIVWLGGCVFFLLYGIVNYILIKWRVQASIILFENVRICDNINTPFLLGYFNPQVYLPSDIDPEQIPYVVMHEKVHLRRFDYVWKTIAYVITAIYWYNPFIRLAYHSFCEDVEFACDEKVIHKLKQGEKKEYAYALIKCSCVKMKKTISVLNFGQPEIKERIRCIMKKDTPLKTKIISNILIVFLLLMVFGLLSYVESDYVFGMDESNGTATEYVEDTYLGGYSEDVGIDEDIEKSGIATDDLQVKIQTNIEEDNDLNYKTVIVIYSSEEIAESEINSEMALYDETLFPSSDEEWNGYGFENLLPNEEFICEEAVYLSENTLIYYEVLYMRAGLNIDVLLTLDDGNSWWSVEFTGGKAEGAFLIPVDGYYRLSVRCSESNLQYSDTALDAIEISGTILYNIDEGR